MISDNYIPEKINEYNAYLDGTKMIGVASSSTLPEVNMQTSTVSGMGVNGEIDSPTLGQFESMEQEIQFNTLYSSAVDMLNPLNAVNLTFRAAQQVYDKSTGGGYAFKSLRIVEMGRVKKFNPGKIEKNNSMEATITLELTYILVEVDDTEILCIDKLNQVYRVNGEDMLADVRDMT
jgi:P2 family phage contractile tail tube protein